MKWRVRILAVTAIVLPAACGAVLAYAAWATGRSRGDRRGKRRPANDEDAQDQAEDSQAGKDYG